MTEILIDYRYWSHICFGPSPTGVKVGERAPPMLRSLVRSPGAPDLS